MSATIISFAPRNRPSRGQPAGPDAGARADIIIFPGVRYERLPAEAERRAAGKAPRKRAKRAVPLG